MTPETIGPNRVRFWRPRALVLIVLFVTAVTTGCRSTGCQRISAEMRQVLTDRQVNQWELNISGLKESATDPRDSDSRMEVLALPSRHHVADAFRYEIVLSTDKTRFWIIRSGGIAGATTVFGPASVESSESAR